MFSTAVYNGKKYRLYAEATTKIEAEKLARDAKKQRYPYAFSDYHCNVVILDRGDDKKYRFGVFIAKGSKMEGKMYNMPKMVKTLSRK